MPVYFLGRSIYKLSFIFLILMVFCISLLTTLTQAISQDQKKLYNQNILYYDLEAGCADSSGVATKNNCVCSSGSGTPTTVPGGNNEEKVWNYLTSKGISPVTVAGIIGNFAEESSYDPTVQEIGQTPPFGGYGIAQWTGTGKPGDKAGSRRLKLIEYIEKAGFPVDLNKLIVNEPVDKTALLLVEMDFMLMEGASIINAMKNITDPGEAARYWMNEYEKPANRIQPAREEAARLALEKYGGGVGVITTTTGSSASSCSTIESGSAGGPQATTSEGYALPVTKAGVNLPCNQSTCHHDGTPAADLFRKEGDPVYAITSGKISNLHYRPGFGRTKPAPPECISLQLIGDDGWAYWYGHIKNATVSNGDTVKAGEQLAVVGQTRCADDTPPHLHIDRGFPKGTLGGSQGSRDPSFIPLLNKIYTDTP
jgi:Phage tail lysozyme/Peptidase family M23